MGDLGSEEVEQQPLEGLHYMGCQSNWSIIIQFSRVRFLSSWDQAQRFPQPRHPPQPQTQVEHMLEGRIKLCSTYLQHFGAHFVWACRLDGGASVHTCAAWWDWSKGGHLSGVMEVEMWGGLEWGIMGKTWGSSLVGKLVKLVCSLNTLPTDPPLFFLQPVIVGWTFIWILRGRNPQWQGPAEKQPLHHWDTCCHF